MYAQQIFILMVLKIERTIVRAMQCFTEIAREMDISRGHHDAAGRFIDADNPLHWVLATRSLFAVAQEAQQFVTPSRREIAFNRNVTGGNPIANAMTGRTDYFVRTGGSRRPLPASRVVNHATIRTNRRLAQFVRQLIRIGRTLG
jgi:hypothetical protein